MWILIIGILSALGSVQVFNLDEVSKVYLPVGGTIEIEASAEIIKVHTWVIEDPELVKLEIKTLKPRSMSKNKMGILNRSAHSLTCSRDCKPGETFSLKMNYKDVKNNIVKKTREIIVQVVLPNEDL
ncbi:hypothetical protein SteCoe_32953 [Stentor coeruleus]|uniref:GOLD domain-containing protein n=1 Tax=Stentor coeruleus TaxID=5963 RepID=A0A1R2AXV1_9CILI|nr:hypothetical protein SteCoe_32953 [Stentor coeruleus]